MKSLFFNFFLISLFAVSAQQKPLFDVNLDYNETGKSSYEEIQQLILENYYYQG